MLSMFTRLEAYERVPSEDRPLAAPTAQNAMANRAVACLPGLMSLPSGTSAPTRRPLNILTGLGIVTLLVASLCALVAVGGSHQTSPAACSLTWAGVLHKHPWSFGMKDLSAERIVVPAPWPRIPATGVLPGGG